MRCAVMQPTYLPWVGYFDLMDQVDTFVLLDNVQFSRGSWQQRNRVKTRQGLVWLSVPVSQKMGSHINEVKISESSFLRKHLETIMQNYSKAEYFSFYYDSFKSVLLKACENSQFLHKLNNELIYYFQSVLGIGTTIVKASNLNLFGERTELLVSICTSIGADTYISPPGSFDYLANKSHLFEEAKIELLFHNYEHPEYKQLFPPFIPYASTVDLLFNEGPDSLTVIRNGRQKLLAHEEMQKNKMTANELSNSNYSD